MRSARLLGEARTRERVAPRRRHWLPVCRRVLVTKAVAPCASGGDWARKCSELQLGSAPVSPASVVADLIVSAVPDPVRQRPVLFDLFSKSSPDRCGCRHSSALYPSSGDVL